MRGTPRHLPKCLRDRLDQKKNPLMHSAIRSDRKPCQKARHMPLQMRLCTTTQHAFHPPVMCQARVHHLRLLHVEAQALNADVGVAVVQRVGHHRHRRRRLLHQRGKVVCAGGTPSPVAMLVRMAKPSRTFMGGPMAGHPAQQHHGMCDGAREASSLLWRTKTIRLHCEAHQYYGQPPYLAQQSAELLMTL